MAGSRPGGPPAVCLTGPTAAGKTRLALALAERHPFGIISVDSAQVYRGMDIGTGKPDRRTLARFPHRLVDIRDPARPYSAAAFRRDALREIEAVRAEGRTPLLVGGAMLYFKALRDGLAELPAADPAARRGIEELAARRGWAGVHEELAKVDPESARRIHPNDPQRLQRALEVFRTTGEPLSGLHRAAGGPPPVPLRFFALMPEDRGELNGRIARRFRSMLDRGLVGEVAALRRRGDLHPGLPSIKSVGYRQVWHHLDGGSDYDAMTERSIIATRQLAKRQLTWLRGWKDLRILGGPCGQAARAVLDCVESAERGV